MSEQDRDELTKYDGNRDGIVRGLVALVMCPRCEGSGECYASESSRVELPCDACVGIGMVQRAIGLADVDKLVRDSLARIAKGY